MVNLASDECVSLFGQIMEGTFHHDHLCTCLSSAYENAILMGESIQNCMLFGHSIENRVQMCDHDCDTVHIKQYSTVDDKDFSGNWDRALHSYSVIIYYKKLCLINKIHF